MLQFIDTQDFSPIAHHSLMLQQRLRAVEQERDQMKRERDYFRNLAMRFPFTLN